MAAIRSARQLAELSPREQLAWRASMTALADMRSDPGLTLTGASARVGVSAGTVRRYAGTALERLGSRVVAKPADRLYRPFYVFSDGERVDIDTRGSRVASRVGAYHAAVGHYLKTGDDGPLSTFNGKRVGGVELDADPASIDRLVRRGEIDASDIYRLGH